MNYEPGQDPRKVGTHRERGPQRFTYTRRDVARLRGVSIATLRLHIRQGKVNLCDLESVVRYCIGGQLVTREQG